MNETVLFVPNGNHYLVGDPAAPHPWIGQNPDALAALHLVVSMSGAWTSVESLGGCMTVGAVRNRLKNAARGLTTISPMLAAELRRGLHCKRSDLDGTTVCHYDRRGAVAFVETRPKTLNEAYDTKVYAD